MTKKEYKNKKVTVVDVCFKRPTSLRWKFSVFVSLKCKVEDKEGKTVEEIRVEKEITDAYVRHFKNICSENAKQLLLKTAPKEGFTAINLRADTDTVCFGQLKRNYTAYFDKGTFDPWIEGAANKLFAH